MYIYLNNITAHNLWSRGFSAARTCNNSWLFNNFSDQILCYTWLSVYMECYNDDEFNQIEWPLFFFRMTDVKYEVYTSKEEYLLYFLLTIFSEDIQHNECIIIKNAWRHHHLIRSVISVFHTQVMYVDSYHYISIDLQHNCTRSSNSLTHFQIRMFSS